ncbi:MAG: (Fe-S)-binding protein [Clostridiales bacterium]|jgi:Fe-S oxidoreductase|nr:(Fe-S)-binding protein [Clostridiales bacterium]
MSRKAFLPGCALPSYNPQAVEATIRHLKNIYPDLSVVQKCCGKPTIAVGQAEKFAERFAGLVEDIKYCEADEVIVACQSCMKTLKGCEDYKTTSLWELLPLIGLPKELVGKARDSDVVFSVHDSCSVRDYTGIHNGIRWTLAALGYKFVDPPGRARDMARCCGFGGMIVPVSPDIAQRVMRRRVDDFPTSKSVVYCAACRSSFMTVGADSWHILDLLFGDVVYENTPPPANVLASPLKAWGNRHKSKRLINTVMK